MFSLEWILGKNTEEIVLAGKVWYVMEGITLGMVLLYHAEEVGGVALNGVSEWLFCSIPSVELQNKISSE